MSQERTSLKLKTFRVPLALTFLGCVACSGGNAANETPYPISPKPPLEEALNRDTNTQTSRKVILSPTLTYDVPKDFCDSSVVKSTQVADENEKNGAVMALARDDNLQDSVLVYRIAGTSNQPGSFLMVSDMVFGEAGTHPIGNYVFELQSASGQNCRISIFIGDDDAKRKELFTISAKFP